ncbi:TPA: hypothetical protein ACIJRN_000968 [Klebsiella aerogenes]
MKILLPLTLTFLLTGCLGVVADMDSTNYQYVPYIQTLQKADTIGHTDREQRKRDIYACGVGPYADLNDKFWQPDVGYPNLSLKETEKFKDLRSGVTDEGSLKNCHTEVLINYIFFRGFMALCYE